MGSPDKLATAANKLLDNILLLLLLPVAKQQKVRMLSNQWLPRASSVPLHEAKLDGHLGLNGVQRRHHVILGAAVHLKYDLAGPDGGSPVVKRSLAFTHAHLQQQQQQQC
jgi:hypothetical protein